MRRQRLSQTELQARFARTSRSHKLAIVSENGLRLCVTKLETQHGGILECRQMIGRIAVPQRVFGPVHYPSCFAVKRQTSGKVPGTKLPMPVTVRIKPRGKVRSNSHKPSASCLRAERRNLDQLFLPLNMPATQAAQSPQFSNPRTREHADGKERQGFLACRLKKSCSLFNCKDSRHARRHPCFRHVDKRISLMLTL